MSKANKKSAKKSNKGMAKIIPLLIPIAGMALTFIIGLSINDYQYRNIPRQVTFTQKSTTEQKTETKLIQAKGLSNTLVAQDAEIIVTVYDLVGDKNLPQDRVHDIDDLLKKRQPTVDAINAL